MSKKFSSAFTLIELLVVIGILGILLAIVLIAINPAAQFAQANNTARTNDVNTILNAIHQYGADNKGLLPTGIPTADNDPLTPLADDALEIKYDSAAGANGVDWANICGPLSPDYVSLLPVDPDVDNGAGNGAAVADCTVSYGTGYFIVKDTNGRVVVSAPGAETVRGVTPVIQVTR